MTVKLSALKSEAPIKSRMANGKPREHHYVPQGYLRGFTETKNDLFVVNKEFNTIRKTSPKGVGYIKDFYTVDTIDEKDSAEVEENLGKIESKCIPLLDKLMAAKDLPNDEWADIAIYIALQYGRTPHMRNLMDKVATVSVNNYIKEALAEALNDPVKYTELKNGVAGQSPDAPPIPSREKLAEMVLGPRIVEEFNLDNGTYVQSIFRIAWEIADSLLKRHWTILHAPKNSCFITSDNPMTLSINRELLPYETLAVLLPGVVRHFPLNSKACLVITDETTSRGISHQTISKNEVRKINKLLYVKAFKYVITGNEKLLKSLISVSK